MAQVHPERLTDDELRRLFYALFVRRSPSRIAQQYDAATRAAIKAEWDCRNQKRDARWQSLLDAARAAQAARQRT